MSIIIQSQMTTMPISCEVCEYGLRYNLSDDVGCAVLHRRFDPAMGRPATCPLMDQSSTVIEPTASPADNGIIRTPEEANCYFWNDLTYVDLTMDRLQNLVELTNAAFAAAYRERKVSSPLRIGINLVNRVPPSNQICAAFLDVTSPDLLTGKPGYGFTQKGIIFLAPWADKATMAVFLQVFQAWCDSIVKEAPAKEGEP